MICRGNPLWLPVSRKAKTTYLSRHLAIDYAFFVIAHRQGQAAAPTFIALILLIESIFINNFFTYSLCF